MNWVDFWVVFTVAALTLAVIILGPVRRAIKAKKDHAPLACQNCPVGNQKKAEYLLKDFKRAKKKEEKKKS
jgi:hypothetical protein